MNKRYPTLEELNNMSLGEVGDLAVEMEKDGVDFIDYYYSDDLLQEDEVIFIKKT